MDEKNREELDRIIREKQIRTVFQPIVSLRDGNVLGHEALSRMTCRTTIEGPEQLFRIAGQHDRLWDLELLCRTTALQTAFLVKRDHKTKKIFLNVNPNVMHDEKFRNGFTKEYLTQYGIEPENIIFEITERNAISDIRGFQGTVSHYKQQNYRIAIDDVGAGFSGLNLISDIHPHYIKLDNNLIHGINDDSTKYALVKSMAELSKTANIRLIAEGVETREELSTLIDLGVQYAQGYFLKRPEDDIGDIGQDVRDFIVEQNRRKNHMVGNLVSNIYIQNICTQTETIPPGMNVEKVFEKMKGSSNTYGLCVVAADGSVLGIITKTNLLLQLSGRYGFSLNQHRTIASLLDQQFLMVDCHTPIDAVSTAAMSRPPDKLYDFIVVVKNGRYLGTVTVKDLLQKTTEVEVANAKFQSPLTGLPGNVIIDQQISRCISSGQAYSIMYFDIDNFKAYNDVYGFESGDKIIKLLASSLTAHLPPEQFVGHVGGDDFVAILQSGDAALFCKSVIEEFGRGKLQFYRGEDLERGYILAENRRGEVEEFPFVSLSVAGVLNGRRRFRNMVELSEELAKLKKKSKQQKGDSCLWLEEAEHQTYAQSADRAQDPVAGLSRYPLVRWM